MFAVKKQKKKKKKTFFFFFFFFGKTVPSRALDLIALSKIAADDILIL